ncbi:MAG: DUF2958 domain-containing protein [Acidiphilium sp.]|nr:DUF2958 domain-containing protein [Acidiphilium sp.]
MPPVLTDADRHQLMSNARATAENDDLDPQPVVRLFLLGTNASWLLTELMPHDPDTAFGLCDLGMGCPELGYVSISEISGSRLPLMRDPAFRPTRTLSEYATIANREGIITL